MMDSADNAALALALSDTAGAVEALWKDHGTCWFTASAPRAGPRLSWLVRHRR